MKLLVLFLTAALTAGWSAPLVTRALVSPAAPDSQCSNLTAASDGTLYLTWCGPGDRDGERALRLASLPPGATAWSAPRTVISTPLLLENWADFASLVVGTDGALTAQWFQKAAPDARGYDGWFARSTDRGATWSRPAPLGHEFVALASLSGGRTLAVWLESTRGRSAETAPRPKRDPHAPRPTRDPGAPYAPAMKLLGRMLAPDGGTLGEWTIDPDVCTCCQNTVTTLPGDRVFVAYRGHTADEIRDNKYALFEAGKWSAPRTLKDDLWKINACPVNGPAVDSRDDALAVAWFTAANGVTRVQARLSLDGGRTLGAALPIDLGKPMGRVETVMLVDRSALILWMEMGTTENSAGIYARRISPDGRLSAALQVADSTQARASGFPRAAQRPDGKIVMSWTQANATNQVCTLEFDPAALVPAAVSQLPAPPAKSLYSGPLPLEFCAAPLVSAHASRP